MILYINACVRDESRTDRLARRLLDKLGEYTELKLAEENLKPLDKGPLEYRSELIYAEMLDIVGSDPEKILNEAIDEIEKKQV